MASGFKVQFHVLNFGFVLHRNHKVLAAFLDEIADLVQSPDSLSFFHEEISSFQQEGRHAKLQDCSITFEDVHVSSVVLDCFLFETTEIALLVAHCTCQRKSVDCC